MKLIDEYSLDNLVNGDILTDTGNKLLSAGYIIRAKDKKITPVFHSVSSDVPWVYVRPNNTRECNFWHQIVFETYGLFPTGCLNCWKVVVRPRTVKELFMLHEYQNNVYDNFCKCGIEVRKYVFGNYGGYFYNDSLEQGMDCYRRVREDITKFISPNIPVILKRACTEYEMKYGDSRKWEELITDAMFQRIEMLKANIDLNEIENNESQMNKEGISYSQPPFVKVAVMRLWLEHAYSLGDETALEFNEGGKHFYTPVITYHNGKGEKK